MAEHRPDGNKPPRGDRIVLVILTLLLVPFILFFLWVWISGTGPWGSADTPPGPGHI
ncbi:hypothetical protein [Kitasatospora sp. NPDC017646]|uniref:hypothetical protein n=1 Tax=Kitasatospora sp. NPDC017646 TaxID=3364024 RepID=UPI00379526F0